MTFAPAFLYESNSEPSGFGDLVAFDEAKFHKSFLKHRVICETEITNHLESA